MSLKTICPNCRTTFGVDPEAPNGVVNCPNCGQMLRLKLRGQKTPAPLSPSPLPADDIPLEEPLPHATQADAPRPEEEALGTVVGVVLQAPAAPERTGKLHFSKGSPTDTSILLSGAVAGAVTAVFYFGLVRPFLRDTRIGQILLAGDWVSPVTVLLTFWAASILMFKLFKLLDQKRSLQLPLLPGGKQADIHPGNIDLLQANLRKLPRSARRSFLVNRIDIALEHFKVRMNVQEVGSVLSAQAEIDVARVDTSYMMLKVFIWAIPILGFVGTVIGISAAVTGFTGAVQNAGDLDTVKTALGTVTSGLAVAFDTTLLALILSIFIMFPANSLQKAEEELLTSIDQYCHERLLRNLREDAEPAAPPVAALAPPPQPAADPAMVPAVKQLTEAVGLLLTELRARSEPEARLAALRQQEQTLAQAMKDHLALISTVGNQLISSMAPNQTKDGQSNHN